MLLIKNGYMIDPKSGWDGNYDILVDGENWTLIDYEWTFGKQVEARELAFRAVYCYLLEDEKRNRLELDWILDTLGGRAVQKTGDGVSGICYRKACFYGTASESGGRRNLSAEGVDKSFSGNGGDSPGTAL